MWRPLLVCSDPSERPLQAVVCLLLEATNNPEFPPPPFLTPMYRLGVNEGTLRVVELDLCASHGANDGLLRAAAVAALADPKPSRSIGRSGRSSARIGSAGTSPAIGTSPAPASATDTRSETPPVNGRPPLKRLGSSGPASYPANAGSSASASSCAMPSPSPLSSQPEQWVMFYFPYIAGTAELNWEAPCRVDTRDDLVRAHLHVVEATTRVRVPLSVNGYQHHPVVRWRISMLAPRHL